MINARKAAVRRCINMAAYRYGQVIFCAKWVMCVAVTLLFWGGAIWFGSLAWDQKQGAILGLMGFGAWLAVCRLVLPGFWYLSINVFKQLFRYINYRLM